MSIANQVNVFIYLKCLWNGLECFTFTFLRIQTSVKQCAIAFASIDELGFIPTAFWGVPGVSSSKC